MTNTIQELRDFISENFLFGQADGRLSDDASFIENGIIDSTGILTMIAFLESRYGFRLADEEITPDNLDSLCKLNDLIHRKLADNSTMESRLEVCAYDHHD